MKTQSGRITVSIASSMILMAALVTDAANARESRGGGARAGGGDGAVTPEGSGRIYPHP
jgi:hypothetical protein